MDIQQKLDRSSPIVQRVLLLRERMARQDAISFSSESADRPHREKIYEWQMWQKSDLSAYIGDRSVHRCKH